MFELTEVTPDGRKFITTISVVVGYRKVSVFVAMEIGSVTTSVTHIKADVKCPRLVRDLLNQTGDWYHGQSLLQPLSVLNGFEAGESLAEQIQGLGRTVPSVVVSRVQGQFALPQLDERLAHDLSGLANVFSVDEAASWGLTDVLRKPHSTFGGAIRIYWPRFVKNDNPFRHQLWTASRLRGLESDPHTAADRIRRQVRTIIMSASAASVVPPSEIDEIRAAVAKAEHSARQARAFELEELKARATSLEEYRDIATLYAADKDTLQHTVDLREADVDRLEKEVHKLKAEKQSLLFALGQAKAATDEADHVQPDPPEQDDADQLPTSGETRFYKKTHSKPSYDILTRVDDCGHNAWQGAAKAEKARKGLARLLGGQGEWKNLHHCGSCTGGGMWRVQW